MRITLNELRRIIREALDEYTPEEIREFEQDEKLYSELIIQAMKNASEDWSIHLLKFGKKTMPAGSQSPKWTSTRWMTA